MDGQMRKNTDKLYQLYGFNKDFENAFCSVFIYEQGYFNNAEIVVFNDKDINEIEKIKNDYMSAGYSVSIRTKKDDSEMEDLLFNGFFRIEVSNQRVIKEYDEFCRKQSLRLGGAPYSYIQSHYTLNGTLESENILERIYDFFNLDDSQLVILEAPAGFGKTCTSYEMSNIIAKREKKKIPILAELSKNRTARIFDYVLLTEIDRKFTKLSSYLVTEQIIKGKIPLIIDGFDELLSKSSVETETGADDVQSMLDTIANLLGEGSHAKILLTSRKSSIFIGDIFDEWVEKRLGSCNVNRIQILAPTVDEWIGINKKSLLETAGINLNSVANPVLLSMLRGISLEEFAGKFQTASDVLETYLELLLSREKDRQQLLISNSEQRMIMRRLAAMMVILDISSDEPEGIKALIEEIVTPKMREYLDVYNTLNSEEYLAPTEDEFLMKLVHSALLDRVSLKSNYIGFINEFIFGIFIGEALLNGELKFEDISEQYFNMAITSFAAEKMDSRDKLFEILVESGKALNTEQKLLVELNLTGRMEYDYVDEYIADIVFTPYFNMRTQHYFYNCIFSSCTFDKNTLNANIFEGCYFFNCIFYDLDIQRGDVEEASAFVSCRGQEKLQEIICNSVKADEIIIEKDQAYYEKLVLEQYWMPGSDQAELRKSAHTLYKGTKTQERSCIMEAIEALLDKQVLRKRTYCLELNLAKMNWIKETLGR